jgi:hypothetical protein
MNYEMGRWGNGEVGKWGGGGISTNTLFLVIRDEGMGGGEVG